MESAGFKVLDNPVWHALQTEHRQFAIGNQSVKRYPSDILHMMGYENARTVNLNYLEKWATVGEKLYMVGEVADQLSNWSVCSEVPCMQMTCTALNNSSIKFEANIVRLQEHDKADMLALINLVQPGYFFSNTPLLGTYYGIKINNRLVAIAGKRLRITAFTEISAVCTHPDHRSKGYAFQLVKYIAEVNIKNGKLPFLHFVKSNTRALEIYKRVGFKERRLISFTEVVLNNYSS